MQSRRKKHVSLAKPECDRAVNPETVPTHADRIIPLQRSLKV